MLVAIAVVLTCYLIIRYLFVVNKPDGMPPGPKFRVPLLGSAIHIGKDPLKGISKLRKQ